MAITGSTSTMDTATIGGPDGHGKHHGRRKASLIATTALGLALLTGGLLGHGWPIAQTVTPRVRSDPVASETHVATMWEFREDHRGSLTPAFVADRFTYREDHRVAITVWTPNFWTYREDHR
jgi:hypothetical protein